MKHLYSFMLCLHLLLAACASSQTPLPTQAPQASVPTTVPLPTSPAATPTQANTPTTAPRPSPTLLPTDTATPTAVPPPAEPFTEGMIAILWNPERDQFERVVTYQLDLAFPGPSPDEWTIQTVLTGLTARYMFPSPDGLKLVLAQYQDTNEDGYIPSPRGGDGYDIDLYSLTTGSLERLTNINNLSYPEVDWLFDSQSFTYPVKNNIWQTMLDETSLQLLPDDLGSPIFGQTWSKDGRFLAITSHSVNGYSVPELDRLDVYDIALGDMNPVFENMPITVNMAWSKDSNWLAVAPGQGGGLYLIDRSFNDVEIVTPDSELQLLEWSPDSRYLAFIEGFSRLRLWEAATGVSRDLISPEPTVQLRALHWSPDSQEIAVTIWNEGQVDLAVVNLNSGVVQTMFTVDQSDRSERPYGLEVIDEIQLLGWSPDGQWLLFFAEREESGLYIINRNGGAAHLVLQTGMYQFFQQSFSTSEIDRTRHVVWLSDLLDSP